jgi:hypothetical protein
MGRVAEFVGKGDEVVNGELLGTQGELSGNVSRRENGLEGVAEGFAPLVEGGLDGVAEVARVTGGNGALGADKANDCGLDARGWVEDLFIDGE